MADIKVRRANVVLTIPDYQQNEYLAKGFDVIDSNGRVIVKTTPNDINSLKKAYKELCEKVDALEKENKALKKALKSSETIEEEPEDDEFEEIPDEELQEDPPTRKKSKKKR